jgi:hypothetical protein
MTRVCFKVQVMSNYNMNTIFLGFKQGYIREFSLSKAKFTSSSYSK